MIKTFSGDYAFLSNFHPVEVVYNKLIFPSVEHAYQAAKTLDEKSRIRISKLSKASEAKRVGRKLEIRPDWDEIKLNIMEYLLRQKFTVGKNFRLLGPHLIATGKHELVEGNWWGDTFWGVCKGVGENHLGRLLMKIRKELQDD